MLQKQPSIKKAEWDLIRVFLRTHMRDVIALRMPPTRIAPLLLPHPHATHFTNQLWKRITNLPKILWYRTRIFGTL